MRARPPFLILPLLLAVSLCITATAAAQAEQQLAFKGCQKLFEDKDPRASACYVGLADKWPQSDLADTSLFNAAIAADMSGDAEGALNACKRIVTQYPKSRHGPRAHAMWARHEELQGNLEAATHVRMRLAHRYPADETSADALMMAAAWFVVREDWKRLDRVAALYLKYYGREDDARHISALAVLNPGLSDCSRVLGAAPGWLKRWKERGALRDRVELLWARCLEAKKPREAARVYQRLAKVGGEFSLEAQFRLVDLDRGQPATIRLRGKTTAGIRKELQARLAAVRDLTKRYEGVLTTRGGQGRDLPWRLAALVRKAEILENLARDIRTAPVPKGLAGDPDARAIYIQALEEQAEPLEAQAVVSYEAVLAQASELGHYDEFVALARTRLSQLRGGKWPKVAGTAVLELGPAPPGGGTAKEKGDEWDALRRKIAWNALEKGDLPLAVYHLQSPGDDLHLLQMSAVVAARQERWSLALYWLRRAAALDPENPLVAKNLATLRAGLGL